MRRLRLAALALATSIAAVAPSAYADPSPDDIATAKALGQEGLTALDAKDYKTAEDRFGRAWKLYPDAITLGLNYARALAAEGKLVGAQVAYNKVANTVLAATAPEPFVNAKAAAQAEVQALAPRIGSVVITVTAEGGGELPNLKVTLDGDNVNVAGLGVKRPVDPGNHVVSASADGFNPGDAKFSIKEGGNAQASITLSKLPAGAVVPPPTPVSPGGSATGTPAPEPPPSGGGSGKTAAWVSYGIGGAGLIVGGITGILAISKHSTLSGECPNGTCSSSTAQSDLSSYHTMGIISDIGFAVAIAGAGIGTYFLLTSSSAPPPPTTTGIHPFIGPGSIGAYGRF